MYLFVFIVTFFLYYFTSFPSLPGGDSGELLADSCLLGTAHPPGYPTFLLLSHAWEHLPLSRFYFKSSKTWAVEVESHPSMAWKVNVMCGCLGALCAMCIARMISDVLIACNRRKLSQGIAFVCAVLFACSPLVWEYSVTAEVFALNNAILACQLMLTIKIIINSDVIHSASHGFVEGLYLSLGALLSGLAISNQHSSFIQQVIVIPFAFFVTIRRLSLLRVIMITIAFLLGISPYYYLVIASGNPKLGSWGNQTTWHGFITHVLRSEYGTFQLGVRQGVENMWQRIIAYVTFSSGEFHHVLFPFAALSLVVLVKTWTSTSSKASATKSIAVKDKTKVSPETTSSTASGSSNVSSTNESEGIRQRKKGSSSNIPTPSKVEVPQTDDENKGKVADKSGSALVSHSKDVDGVSPFTQRKILLCLLSTWLFYVIFWHGILSNLPLSAPMPFAVHSRFWMQPNIPLIVLTGVGIGETITSLLTAVSDPFSNTLRPSLIMQVVYAIPELVCMSLLGYAIIKSRYPLMDKSRSGWVMHKYASTLLSSLPKNSIFLSHTDLDWNSVRYLWACENQRNDLKLLSLQIMPYPWFKTQQAPLYRDLVFPSTDFPEISTDRMSEGNARLILDFIRANGNSRLSLSDHDIQFLNVKQLGMDDPILPTGIFLDMQAVNEVEIGDGGIWRNMTLLPWGSVYRVLNEVSFDQLLDLHPISLARLNKLRDNFPSVNDKFFKRYPAGSWEFAAASVFYDAHYQFGLSLLTHSLETLKTVDLVRLVLLVDRMHKACKVLNVANQAASKWGSISSPVKDVSKNTALCYMRYQSMLSVAVNFKHNVEKEFYAKPQRIIQNRLFEAGAIDSIINQSVLKEVTNTAITVQRSHAKQYPEDKDAETFLRSAEGMEAEMKKRV